MNMNLEGPPDSKELPSVPESTISTVSTEKQPNALTLAAGRQFPAHAQNTDVQSDVDVLDVSDQKEETSCEAASDLAANRRLRRTFPQKLFALLSREEYTEVVSWLSHGKGFTISNKEEFETEILPRFFKQSKLSSFIRKLNRWGFQRVTRGEEKGAYYHHLFRRGEEEKCSEMVCRSGPSSNRTRCAKKNIDLVREETIIPESVASLQRTLNDMPLQLPSSSLCNLVPSMAARQQLIQQQITLRESELLLQREMRLRSFLLHQQLRRLETSNDLQRLIQRQRLLRAATATNNNANPESVPSTQSAVFPPSQISSGEQLTNSELLRDLLSQVSRAP